MTVEEIDQALLKIASHNPKSSPEVRSLAPKIKNYDMIALLGNIYQSLGSREAKWFTRLVLKDYGPITFPEHLHFAPNMQFLPNCVRVNGEISISEAFPVLRDGARLINGTASGNSTAKWSLRSPVTVSPDEVREVKMGKMFFDQMPTPSTKTPPKETRAFPTLKASAKLLSPSTTNPQSSSPAVKPRSAHNTENQSQRRAPLAPLELNSTPSQHSSPAQAYNAGTPILPSSIPRDDPVTSIALSSFVTETSLEPHSNFPQGLQSCHSISNARSSSHHDVASTETGSYRARSSSISLIINGTGMCRLTTQLCPLINCIFVLSPCISNIPYITEDLLSWHGSRIITSLPSFSDPSLPRYCPRTGKRYRKVALVETNRTGPTAEFIKRISRLNLTRKRGRNEKERKEWVEVYDWRILESIAKMDQGQEKGYNPWRRNWVGAV